MIHTWHDGCDQALRTIHGGPWVFRNAEHAWACFPQCPWSHGHLTWATIEDILVDCQHYFKPSEFTNLVAIHWPSGARVPLALLI
jgi:hypothetical protein